MNLKDDNLFYLYIEVELSNAPPLHLGYNSLNNSEKSINPKITLSILNKILLPIFCL